MSTVTYETDGNVAVLTMDNPPVNALSYEVRDRIREGLEKAAADEAIDAIVLTAKGKLFSAGNDLSQFGKPKPQNAITIRELEDLIEKSSKPVIAAFQGKAVGGGLEVALACHGRVATEQGGVSLPEVDIGFPPSAGGTQRLPRLTGVEAAIDIMAGGKPVSAKRALDLGIVDAIVDDARNGGIAFAREAVAQGRELPPVLSRNERVTGIDPQVFADARKKHGRKARGRLAPMAVIDCVEAATTMSPEDGMAFEAKVSHELATGEQAAALRYYFFAEREARKIPDLPADVQAKPIKSLAVVGAGLMGGGIAMSFANAGIPVTILDLDQEALDRGMAVVRKNYDVSVGRGSMAQEKADKAFSLIGTTLNYEDLGACDIVIEAALERLDVKQEVFRKLDMVMKQGAILATNTSYISIDEIAKAVSRPEDFIGCHFFSPANVMKLLENVRGAKTSGETIKTVMEMGRVIGKIPVLAGNCEGFIGNRMLQYYTGEAEFLLEQGATPEQIDRVALNFGMAMGPISMRDLSGMKMAVIARAERARNYPPGERLSPIVERLVEAGRYGQQNGKGFYRYEGREKHSDPEVMEIIEGVSKEFGIERREFSDEDVEARLFAPLVNEGAKEIEEGIAIRASDIDVAWVNGYGFPVHKGGPMYWGERFGLDRVYEMALAAEKRNGPRWAPGELLRRLASEGKGWDAA